MTAAITSRLGYQPRVTAPRTIQASGQQRLTEATFLQALKRHVQKHAAHGLTAMFTMEVYNEDGRPGGGGLGTLSGDWLRGYADVGEPIVGITIGHKYLQQQHFDNYLQEDVFVDSKMEDNPNLTKLSTKLTVNIQGKDIQVEVWGSLVEGRDGEVVPVLLLNTSNCGEMGFERITDRVYPGGQRDAFATLGQELLLAIGGIDVLKQLRVPIAQYHVNDAHAALVSAKLLLDAGLTPETLRPEDVAGLREKVIYTSHTLIAAASDTYYPHQFTEMIRDARLRTLAAMLGAHPDNGEVKRFDDPTVTSGAVGFGPMIMTAAGRMNAVSALNGELLRANFPQHTARIIGGITNATHPNWTVDSMMRLFDEYAPGWQIEPEKLGALRKMSGDPEFRVNFWGARMEARIALAQMIKNSKPFVERAGLDPGIFARELDPSAFTVGFARRVAAYKRHNLLVHDLAALVASISADRPIQFVFGGKAHPKDDNPGGGKYILRELLLAGQRLNKEFGDRVTFNFLPNYDVGIARVMIPGVDLWLNTPIWGWEASGTSTMDAIQNGVLLLVTDDGCIPEMRTKGDVGFVIGRRTQPDHRDEGSYLADSYAVYAALSAASEMFYHALKSGALESGAPSLWMDKMISVVVDVTPYFLTPRMIGEYHRKMLSLGDA